MKIDVKKIAELASLTLSEKDTIKLTPQLEEIIAYIEKLNSINTTDTIPTAQVTGLTNVLREDTDSRPSLSQEDALSGTVSKHNGMFQVKGILEEK